MIHFICFLLNSEHLQCKLTGNQWKVAKHICVAINIKQLLWKSLIILRYFCACSAGWSNWTIFPYDCSYSNCQIIGNFNKM